MKRSKSIRPSTGSSPNGSQPPNLHPKDAETVRRLISAMVGDVLAESGRQLRAFKPASVEEIRQLRTPMVTFSAQMREKNRVLQAFLSHRMYRHERVLAISAALSLGLVDGVGAKVR